MGPSTQLRLRHGSVQICREVTRQKKRLGGDFAWAVVCFFTNPREDFEWDLLANQELGDLVERELFGTDLETTDM